MSTLETDRRQKGHFCGRRHGGSDHVYTLFKVSPVPPYTISCVTYTVQVNYSPTWRFHYYPVIVWWTGMVWLHSQTFVKSAPVGCLLVHICMCMAFGITVVLHMNGTHCTMEVYNFLRESPMAGHLFVWVGGTKDEPRGQRGPRVDFTEREQQLTRLSLCRPEQDF